MSATGGGSVNPQTQVNASATGANSVATATLPAVAGKTNSLSGIVITGAGATAASDIVATVTGVQGGPLSFAIAVPAGVTAAITPIVAQFNPPLQATGPNTAITLSVPAAGVGNTNIAAVATGYVQ